MGQYPYQHTGELPRRRRTWLWLLLGTGLLVALSCGGCFTWLIYAGSVGPDTSVYAGNQVPGRFLDTMREVGALEEGEQVRYFYSDAFTDIREGFCFVSDRRVVVYRRDGAKPLISEPFDQIADASLDRNESFFTDSVITLHLVDGTPIAFPVSSENGGDKRFHEEIRKQIE